MGRRVHGPTLQNPNEKKGPSHFQRPVEEGASHFQRFQRPPSSSLRDLCDLCGSMTFLLSVVVPVVCGRERPAEQPYPDRSGGVEFSGLNA